jgi:predicted branched-subunit amino acid permease
MGRTYEPVLPTAFPGRPPSRGPGKVRGRGPLEYELMTSFALAASPGPTVRAGGAARRGAVAMLPLLAGYVPFALVIGSACADHGSALAGWAGSWLIYGGSAHLAAIRTLDHDGAAAAIFTGLLINARLVVYSASLARRWRDQPRWFRMAAAGLIIDPTWAMAERQASDGVDPAQERWYFIGAGLALGLVWSAAIAVGILVGPELHWLDLDIVIPLCLIGLVGLALRSAASRAVIVAAASTALLTTHWPAGSGILAAVLVGCAVGWMADQRWPS